MCLSLKRLYLSVLHQKLEFGRQEISFNKTRRFPNFQSNEIFKLCYGEPLPRIKKKTTTRREILDETYEIERLITRKAVPKEVSNLIIELYTYFKVKVQKMKFAIENLNILSSELKNNILLIA